MRFAKQRNTDLVRHDHQSSISKACHIAIDFVVLKAHDFLDVLNLLVLHDLVVLGLANVEQFAAQREHTEIISSNDAQSCDCERLGGISFCQNQRTFVTFARASVIGV